MSVPYLKIVAKPAFQDFVIDLFTRMGVSETDQLLLFGTEVREKNMIEFAKCFVTQNADPNMNYEMYELLGDTCLNNAITMYMFKVIQATHDKKRRRVKSFVPSHHMTDYLNKLKAAYISEKEFHDIASRMGFEDFVDYGPRDPNPKKDPEFKKLTDSFEAFFGCFEVLMDRFIEPHYSHQYVGNFIQYIFSTRKINFHPDYVYDSITLLKESNDKLKNKGMTVTVGQDRNDSNNTVVYLNRKLDSGQQLSEPIHEIGTLSGRMSAKHINQSMSQRALIYMKSHPELFDPKLIKIPPTPEELGIEELCAWALR